MLPTAAKFACVHYSLGPRNSGPDCFLTGFKQQLPSPMKADWSKLASVLSQTNQELEVLKGDTSNQNAVSPTLAKQLRKLAQELAHNLALMDRRLDPVTIPENIFDPSDPKRMGHLIAVEMMLTRRLPLESVPPFYGAGVYALYYKGQFPAYEAISGSDHPVYVGKADPEQPAASEPRLQGRRLAARLRDHLKAISKTEIPLKDIDCRYLVVASGWQKSAEDYLINLFQPVWNKEVGICYGIGKHGDSAETRKNKRSPWDTLHPGRAWAGKSVEDAKSRAQIIAQIKKHFVENPPYRSLKNLPIFAAILR